MRTVIEQILSSLNGKIGFAGSLITIYDHFKNLDDTHIKETFTAIRNQSKKAYDSYCEYRKYRINDIGIPLEDDILGYWELCLRRDKLPSVGDMESLNIANKEEAEIMLAYLLESWMEINQKLMELVESCRPVIIAGNGGSGKTSMMMRVAVQWVSCGGVAVWLSLSNKDIITEQEAATFFSNLTVLIPDGQRVLLCIDNPYEGKASFFKFTKKISWY